MPKLGLELFSASSNMASGQKHAWRGLCGQCPFGPVASGVTIGGMSDAPTPRRQSSWGSLLGLGAGTAFRQLRGGPGRNKRIFRGVRSGAAAFLGSAMGTLRVLFLEVSGFVFICFTVIIVSTFVREYRKYVTHQVGVERVVLAGAIGAMFFYFGLTSFWRARRRRSRT
jgi:hypothetical protein